MLKQQIRKIWFTLSIALSLGFLFVATTYAQEGTPPNKGSSTSSRCAGCHSSTYTLWEGSSHGQAVADPIFKEAWKKKGSPKECLACHTTGYDQATGTWVSEGITCEVCHRNVPTNHPEEVAPTDLSSRLCGNCHLDTYDEWQQSVHGQEALTCHRCHNPHTTKLRAENAQELCLTCHKDQPEATGKAPHSIEQGLLCVDCHLKVVNSDIESGHGKHKHLFTVDLDTCIDCHWEDMSGSNSSATASAIKESNMIKLPSSDQSAVTTEPNSFSPIGFIILAALSGMAGGMILTPWLEHWYQNITAKKKDGE